MKKYIYLGGFVAVSLLAVVLFFALKIFDPLTQKNQCQVLVNDNNYKQAFSLCLDQAKENNAVSQYYLAELYAAGNGVVKDQIEANKWYARSAAQGDARSQLRQGLYFKDNFTDSQNHRTALKWITLAAEQNYAPAQYHLGLIYYVGITDTKDNNQAFKWMKKSAEQGYMKAELMLGQFYQSAIGTKKNAVLAYQWYKKAEAQGDVSAATKLAIILLNGEGVTKNTTLAFELLTKSAQQEDAEGQYELARLYSSGNGVKKNIVLARRWYSTAALQSYPPAQLALGLLYLNGEGVAVDIPKGLNLIHLSAKKYTKSQYRLGVIYEKGIHVEADRDEALYWYKKASSKSKKAADAVKRMSMVKLLQEDMNRCRISYVNKQYKQAYNICLKLSDKGNSHGSLYLGRMYHYGYLDKNKLPDHKKAFYWYQKAARDGDVDAEFEVARAYELGRGVAQSVSKAFSVYTAAAESGSKEAQMNLGLLYFKDKQYIDAFKWLSKAVKKTPTDKSIQLTIARNAYVYFYLGLCYEFGYGVVENKDKAIEIYNIASNYDSQRAKYRLGFMYLNGIGVKVNYKEAYGNFVRSTYDIAVNQYGDLSFKKKAEYYVGFMHENGLSVPKNLSKAKYWYARSAKKGYQKAETALQRLSLSATIGRVANNRDVVVHLSPYDKEQEES